jgi:glycosyltransferase involved in cell wall biosynthesis
MSPELPRGPRRVVVIAARNEEERIVATIASIKTALPGARLVVADDGSTDTTAALAAQAGAEVSAIEQRGKGEAATAALRFTLSGGQGGTETVVLCDGDLGVSAGELRPLVEAVESGRFREPAPIGFYFAKLWYFEKLYPLIFTVAALGRATRDSRNSVSGS